MDLSAILRSTLLCSASPCPILCSFPLRSPPSPSHPAPFPSSPFPSLPLPSPSFPPYTPKTLTHPISDKHSVKDVPQEKLEVLCNFIQKRMVNAGEQIFFQGELGSHFYIVLGGSVRVYAEKNHHVAMQRLREIKEVGDQVSLDLLSGILGQQVKTYGANDGFGELSLSGSNPMRNGEYRRGRMISRTSSYEL